MGKAFNYEVSVSDPAYVDNRGSWSIYDFGVGKRVTPDSWKPVSNGEADKTTEGLRKALAANHNLVSFAIDPEDLTNPTHKRFPRLTPGKRFDQVLVRVNSFMHGRILKKGEKYVDMGDGHSTGDGEFGVIDNVNRGLITLFHVVVLENKTLSVPQDVFISARTGAFVSSICKVGAARLDR